MIKEIKLLGVLLTAVLLIAGCTSVNTTPSSTPASSTDNATNANTATNTPAAASNGGGLTFTLTPGKSTALYKVREQLAGLSLPSDAIGKTSQVSGSVTIKADGTIDSNTSKFVVDLSTLVSDQSRRDNFIKQNTLGTAQYPNATFVPTQADGLPNPLPTSGQVNFQLTGNLTIRDVTKPVTWTVTGTVSGGTATGTAITTFKFEDFNLTQPRVPVVLSVVDSITLEIDINLQR